MSRGLDRRTVLRGLGACLALPWLEATHARASTPADVSTVWVLTPNGMRPQDWLTGTTPGAGPLVPSGSLASLAPVADEILAVRGLQQRYALAGGDNDHAANTGAMLTGRALDTVPGAPVDNGSSADQLLVTGRGLRSTDALVVSSDRGWGSCAGVGECVYLTNASWSLDGRPVAPLTALDRVFTRLFGDPDDTVATSRAVARRQHGASILDLVLDDAASLQTRLGGEDRARFDAWATGVRALEQGLGDLDRTCQDDAAAAWRAGDVETPTLQDQVDLLRGLVVVGLQCGAVPAVVWTLAVGASDRTYPEIGAPTPHHALSHRPEDPGSVAELQRIEAWMVAQYAALVQGLRDAAEGAGTALDRCQVVFLNECRDGDTHDTFDLPCLVAGRAGGAIRTGREIDTRGKPVGDLHQALLGNAGVVVDRVGPFGSGVAVELG